MISVLKIMFRPFICSTRSITFDLSEARRQLKPFYSHTGRPSVDPELMIRMLLIGYYFGIRPERRL